MQDLTPVGLSQDGTRLLLVNAAGEEFAVPVDPALRSALRGQTTRPAPQGQLEMKMESALRPRDIQARIRAGETPEAVAQAAQTTVESIMAFASPVLAERAHVAQTALKASVRRPAAAGTGARTLGESAELYFASHGLHEEDVEWDAWRRPDGRWALVAAYAVDGRARVAELTHDLAGRYVLAENDDARLLTGELREPTRPGPSTGAATGGSAGRRLSAVPAQEALPLGDDAIELVRERGDASGPPPTRVPEIPEAAGLPEAGGETSEQEQEADPAEQPEARQPAEPDFATRAEPDWLTEAGPAEGGAPRPAGQAPDARDEPEPQPGQQADDQPDQQHEQPQQSDDRSEAPPESGRAPRRKGRSSVPSWDEIMFGGGKGE